MSDVLASCPPISPAIGTSPESDPETGISVLPILRPSDRLADAYAGFIGRIPWQWFCTLTFRPHLAGRTGGVHPESADKAFRFFISSINRELYGANWSKRHHGGLQWVRGTELHKDGRLHFHAVVSAHGADINSLASRYAWHEFWYKHFGRNQIEEPRSQDEICGYVAKYVTKDGVIDFSKNFGAWVPPNRFEAVPRHTGNLIPDQI